MNYRDWLTEGQQSHVSTSCGLEDGGPYSLASASDVESKGTNEGTFAEALSSLKDLRLLKISQSDL